MQAATTSWCVLGYRVILPLVGARSIREPERAPRKAITHHEVVAARVGRPSGRTRFYPLFAAASKNTSGAFQLIAISFIE